MIKRALTAFLAAITTLLSTMGAGIDKTASYLKICARSPYISRNDGKYINFRQSEDGTVLGTWWWFSEDSDDEKVCSDQLNFLERNGTSEIYYYVADRLDTSEKRATVHSFVRKANEHGITVSFLFDDPALALEPNNNLSVIGDKYMEYIGEYPNDSMNGIHLDVEGTRDEEGRFRMFTPDEFVNNLFSQFEKERDRGIRIAMDVNCFWSTKETFTVNGVTGNVYDILCSQCDCITLMSYQDTGKNIWGIGQEAFGAAKRQNCKVVFAVECGYYGEGTNFAETFYDEDISEMYKNIAQVYKKLAKDHPEHGYGIAIHYSRAWLELSNGIKAGK